MGVGVRWRRSRPGGACWWARAAATRTLPSGSSRLRWRSLPLAVFLAGGAPLAWDRPELRGFNFTGGASLSPEFAALLFGLTVYTAAFIAEIVRSGIEGVSRGQSEAAAALGLRRGQALRLVDPAAGAAHHRAADARASIWRSPRTARSPSPSAIPS